jgi:CRP-like cAMP-binding protein
MSAINEMLRRTALFSDLSAEECATIVERGATDRASAGFEFTVQGVPDAGLQVITEGTADVFVHGKHVRRLGVGDYFGEVSLVDDAPRSATIVAGQGGCTTLLISPVVFWDTVDGHPQIARKLMRGLATRLRAAEDALWIARSAE